jgi:AcrR family transcriptional regulator
MISRQDWRQRRRMEAIEEIKQTARKQIAENGAGNLSLGAIARTLGMTTPALYRYFDNRDALVSALIIDAYDSMGEVMEKAAERLPTEDYAGRFLALLRAYRRWAVEYPENYALMYGLPTADVEMPSAHLETFQRVLLRSMRAMVQVLYEAYEAGHLVIPELYYNPPSAFRSALVWMQTTLQDTSIPLGILVLALTIWIWADGLVWQELHGHLPKMLFGDGAFYEMECHILMDRLGIG